MSNNRITPFVKRMRTTGGTIYTFSSAVEDIGLNINERNNVVKISHFALLNIPKINEPDNILENRFNVLAIPGAFESWKTGGSIKDGRVIVAESFQNYALNFEANLLNQNSYDSALSRTVSERVFWKWLKETGAIRWQSDVSGYWAEEIETDVDGNTGYKNVVKYFGQVSAGNVRQDSFGTYNETYILVPTSHGQMEPYFEQTEDTNYKHGMQIGDLGENILGRDGWTKPHPDGLEYFGYYDYVDSSTKVWNSGAYNMFANGNPGGWYTVEGLNPTKQNTYMIDTSAYILSGDYNASIKYQSGGDNIEFKRSKVDCMGLVLDLNKLKIIKSNPNLTFDVLAGEQAVNDTFEFNAVLIYYSIKNSVQDTTLATNLLGILFLDAPSGNTQVIGDGALGILLPSLEKIQSGPSGFGTSYNLRLNIKSDNMVDDTAAIIIDAATSDQVDPVDWSQAYYELGKAVNILTQNNSVLNYISGQYLQVQNVQTQMLNELNKLEFDINDITKDIKGTENAIALFSAGDDPLVDSSIYMKNGNVGFFNNDPLWPVQIDASLKAKNIYIEKSIMDASGNLLFSWGSPLNLGSSTNFREISFFTGNPIPAIFIDTSNNITFNGSTNIISGGGTGDVTKLYVDDSLALRDASITDLYSKAGGISQAQAYVDGSLAYFIRNSSIGTGFNWVAGMLNAVVGGGGDVTTTQMNIALAQRDTSISWLKTALTQRDTSISWLNANKQPLGNYATPLYVTTQLGNYVKKTGDTISGNLIVAGGATINSLNITYGGANALNVAGGTTLNSTLDVAGGTILHDTLTVYGGFGANGATPQPKYSSGGLSLSYLYGTHGFSNDTTVANLMATVGRIVTALKNNGIMS